MHARVIVLAGPSGAGKSRLSGRLRQRFGWPTLRLDDFYKDAGDPTLPIIASGKNAGLVDWDHPDSWRREDAMAALVELCRTGSVDVPVYSIAESRHTGTEHLELGGASYLCAEGIFAPDVVGPLREAGVLAAAYCITQHPAVTFWRRLTRDLREHRKPPPMLLWRGLALARGQRDVVRRAVAAGCRVATGDEAYAELEAEHAMAR